MSKVSIKNIASIISGATPSSTKKDFYNGNIVWATPNDLSNQKSKYFYLGERTITQIGYDSCSTKMIPKDNILFSSRAPIGLVAINKVDCCTNQGFKSLVLDKSKCDLDYMYYYLISHKNDFIQLGSGTTFKEISKSVMEDYEFDLPSLKEQKNKVKLLKNIDELIINNNEQIKLIDNYINLYYEYYFSQNDKEYTDAKLGDFETIITKSVKPFENSNIDYEYYSIPAYDENQFPTFEKGSNIKSNKYVVENNTILVSKLNPQFKRLWQPLILSNNCICSTEFIQFKPISIDYLGFLYCILNSDQFQNYLVQRSTSSTNSRKRVTPKLSHDFIIKKFVDNNELIAFSKRINKLLAMMNMIKVQNYNLYHYKNIIMPLLMNGQVTIKDEK